jgi:outer membrane lipoprotein carrier protein
MKHLLVMLMALLSFSSASFVYAESDTGGELVGLLSNLQSMQADFVQTNQDVLRRSSGTMMLLRPGKLRWDVKRPQPQQIIADGKQLWVYDPSLAQVTRHKLGKADTATSPVALLSDSLDQLASQYQITRLAKPGQTGLWFKLLSKTQASMLHWVELYFSDGQLTRMRIADKLDQVTVFSFQHIQINPALNPRLFEFSSPPGVEVVNA